MRVPAEERLTDHAAVATTGGTWSANTGMLYGYLVGVRCRPTTATTVYDLKVVDRDGYQVYYERGIKGEISDTRFRVPIRGVCTVSILNATADEPFTNLKLMVEGP